MKYSYRLLAAALILCFALSSMLSGTSASSKSASSAQSPSVERRIQKQHDLLNEQWEYVLSTNPEFASILGDKRWNDKISDASLEAIQKDLTKTRDGTVNLTSLTDSANKRR